MVSNDRLDYGVVVQQDERLHDVAQAMQVNQTLQVFCHRYKRYQL